MNALFACFIVLATASPLAAASYAACGLDDRDPPDAFAGHLVRYESSDYACGQGRFGSTERDGTWTEGVMVGAESRTLDAHARADTWARTDFHHGAGDDWRTVRRAALVFIAPAGPAAQPFAFLLAEHEHGTRGDACEERAAVAIGLAGAATRHDAALPGCFTGAAVHLVP